MSCCETCKDQIGQLEIAVTALALLLEEAGSVDSRGMQEAIARATVIVDQTTETVARSAVAEFLEAWRKP